MIIAGFSGGSVVKNPPANARNMGSIPRSRRTPEEGNGSLLQYSCLGNPRGAWAEKPGGLQSMGLQKGLDTTERLNDNNDNNNNSVYCRESKFLPK